MGFYLNKESYFKLFSEQQSQIAHNKPASIEGLPRQSFFRINDEEELDAASVNWMHVPCFVMIGLSGRMLDKDGCISQQNNHIVMFLDKLKLDWTDPISATAISYAYDKTFTIMKEFIQYLRDDYEEKCGFDIELGSFRWEQTGPIGDELYGWILSFNDEAKENSGFDLLSNTPAITTDNKPMETIYFNNVSQIIVPYTTARRYVFGDFPTIEVWITEDGFSYRDSGVDISTDLPTPDQTTFTINISGPASGFIIIK